MRYSMVLVACWCSWTAWNSSTGKGDLSSAVSKWCNHQRQIRAADLTALMRNAMPRTFNSLVVQGQCLHFLAAETIHAKFRPDFAFISTGEQLGGIDWLRTCPYLNVYWIVFSFMQIKADHCKLLSLCPWARFVSLSPGAEQWLLQAGAAQHFTLQCSAQQHQTQFGVQLFMQNWPPQLSNSHVANWALPCYQWRQINTALQCIILCNPD